MDDKRSTRILWAGFNLASFTATTLGIASQIGGGEMGAKIILLSAAIAAVIQGIVMLGWPIAGRAVRNGAIVLAFVMVTISLSGSTASGTFASTTYIKNALSAFLGETYTDTLVVQATGVLQPVTDKTLKLQRLMSDYRRFAEDESLREKTSGDSCDGARTQSECGPICRLRAEQAGQARTKASEMRSLVSQIDAVRADAVGISDQDALKALTGDSNRFVRHPLFDSVVDWAKSEKSGFSGRGFEFENKLVQCRDDVAIARLDDIIAAASLKINTATTPSVRDQTYADVAAQNISALSSTVQSAFLGKDALVQTLTTDPAKQFAPYWIISLFVELACACLGLALVPKLGPFPIMQADGFDPDKMKIIADTFERCTLWQGKYLYFFIPFDTEDADLRKNAQLLASQLPTKPFRRRGPIATQDVLAPMEADRYWQLTGATMAEVFIIKNPAKAERNVRFGSGFQSKTPAE